MKPATRTPHRLGRPRSSTWARRYTSQFPTIPGSAPPGTLAEQTKWPLAQEVGREYIDVGQVIITNGPKQLTVLPGTAAPDALGRTHTTWDFSSLNNQGLTFIDFNSTYDVILTGSAEWPAQLFEDVLFMPDQFTLLTPDDTVTPVPLVAGTDLVITYTPPTNTNLPAGSRVDTLVAFTNGSPPSAICVEEGIDGSITIPAATVDAVRAVGVASKILRQHVVHNLRELNDGDDAFTNKRIDFLSVWCYNYPFSIP